MSIFSLKPTSSYVKAYFAALAQFQQHGHLTEGNTRSAFADLLKRGCSPYGWHLVEEFNFQSTKKTKIRADGALIDDLTLQHGIWEAKDTADDLKLEIKKKVEKGYPLVNTLFQSPDHATLYQDSRIAFDKPLDSAENVVDVLRLFFDHQIVPGVDWQKVIKEFSLKIPEIAGGIDTLLDAEHTSNAKFRDQFASFAELCRSSINPDLSDKSIRTMLVQHLLTERIFRKVFNNQEFLQRNVIAVEIEKVIGSITAKHFSRDQFLKSLDHFYIPLERAAEQQEDYTEKQHFLNAVYEKFFQSFDPKQADTMGIVYTPQPIVDFMVRSVEEILKQEFGKSLSDEGVHILDPFTGTGNFITRIMQEIKRSALPHKYAHELHCNEIMLLPYYIASMNIEHAYMEKVGSYSSFEGICLVDTFELAEAKQQGFSFMAEENTKRVRRQRTTPITVVLGNPPYNVGQNFQNDNNKNRAYKTLDKRISETYARDSAASSVSKLSDAYVKAIRWATDRIGEEGVVAFVSNSSFLEQIAHDGMRKNLLKDFDSIYLLDLGGNTRKYPQYSGSTHNVFGIQVGVSIEFFIKLGHGKKEKALRLLTQPANMKKSERLQELQHFNSISGVSWEKLTPDDKHNWVTKNLASDFQQMVPLASKLVRSGDSEEAIFRRYSLGFNSARDSWCCNFNRASLARDVEKTSRFYNQEIDRWINADRPKNVDSFVDDDTKEISWSRDLKADLGRGRRSVFAEDKIEVCLYRPYASLNAYFDRVLNEEVYGMPSFFPPQHDNLAICGTGLGAERPFASLATKFLPNLNFFGPGTVPMWYPFLVYDEDGTNRRENITDWALNEFRKQYSDDTITKWNIFHATYAILHHPEYRARYAANLKRELPRIPFPPDFHSFAAAGQRLMELHIDYEQRPEYRLEQVEDPKADISFRVTKMKLSKDKTELRYNDFLLLRGIPAGVYDYRLGNRSALEWVIDQYQVSTDKRSGIVNDPNREDDPKYILRLIGQVITVSLETNSIIAALPTLGLPDAGAATDTPLTEPDVIPA